MKLLQCMWFVTQNGIKYVINQNQKQCETYQSQDLHFIEFLDFMFYLDFTKIS